MNAIRLPAALLVPVLLFAVAWAQDPSPLPLLPDNPVMWVDAGGPTAIVTSLTFGDGDTLYSAGLDKAVRVWQPEQDTYVLKKTYRVPIGPGNAGAINAVALSPDGAWVAMAGRAPMRGEVGFRGDGVIVEAAAFSPEQKQDLGVIYVASTNPANLATGKILRGHMGSVQALAFAPERRGKPLLVSAAIERQGNTSSGGVRLWDVATGSQLAEQTGLPPTALKPGLAVWNTGQGPKQIRAAVAWPGGDKGDLYLWDPTSERNSAPLKSFPTDDRYTQTAIVFSRNEGVTLLTGGFGEGSGRLRRTRYSDERDPKAAPVVEVAFPSFDQVSSRPLSLAVAERRNEETPSLAAVILEPGDKNKKLDYRLAVVDLVHHQIVANFPLPGSDRSISPALALSGRYLAVAATADHAIRVYALADLLAGKKEPKAILGGIGMAFRQVGFANEGRRLWLAEDPQDPPLSGGLVFDFDKGQASPNEGKLLSDTPDLGDWKLVQADKKSVTVQQGAKKPITVLLKEKDAFVTAWALRPARQGQPGVLAVAYTERDARRSLIQLCDLADGKPYRLLVSHLQDVRWLAFSATRPLLASVADDQTVGVWGLRDIASAVGAIPGLGVADEEGKVVVRRLEEGSDAAKILTIGDVLEKIGPPGGIASPILNAESFLFAVLERSPGDKVALTVAGKGVKQLVVGRGMDERKPLFSLMLLRGKGQRDWVGWSPAGPYDSSNQAAEARVGWLTNTSKPTNPVSFVMAGEHSKEYYREGILRYLAEDASLLPALRRWEKDHPDKRQIRLEIEQPEGMRAVGKGGDQETSQQIKTVRIRIVDDAKALQDKDILRWRLTRQAAKDGEAETVLLTGMVTREGKRGQLDLSKLEWKRGDYRLWVGLVANPAGDVETEAEMNVRFLPPVPVLRVRRADQPVETTQEKPLNAPEDKLTLQFALELPAGQEVNVSFAQSLNGGARQLDAPAPRLQVGPGRFETEFPLQKGLNRLEIRAVNKGALAEHTDAETVSAVVWVTYQPPKELPPRFTELRLDPQPEVKDGQTLWVVSQPQAHLTGKIEGNGILELASWSVGADTKSVLPTPAQRVATFRADLNLEVNRITEVRLRARSSNSDENSEVLRMVYRPPLPDITFAPLPENFFTDKVTLTGGFEPAQAHPFELKFRVISSTGEIRCRVGHVPEVSRAHEELRTWKADLTLFPGTNTVEAIVSNEGRGARTLEKRLKLIYRQLPRITRHLESVVADQTNRVALDITVEGPGWPPWPLTAVKVDGEKGILRAWKTPEKRGGASGVASQVA